MKKLLTALLLSICLLMTVVSSCTSDDTDDTSATNIEETGNVETGSTAAETEVTVPETQEDEPDEIMTEPSTFVFTDSLGREVEVPTNITKVALSGPLTQIALFALCPDKLVGLATAWDSSAEEFLKTEYFNLPLLGQLYGGKGTLNLETIAAAGAEVIIDVGEVKSNMAEDLDNLQDQLGIPTVHIDAYTDGMGDAYRMLGELLNMEEEAGVIADYCDEVYSNTLDIISRVGEDGKANILYCSGESGINVIAKSSYHAEILDLVANNLAVVENPSSRGTGNEVDLEQLMLWNPDIILFAPDSIYDTVGDNADWADITAIKNSTYYEVPYGPYNWIGFPPSVQRYLGLLWLTQLLYPGEAEYDMFSEVSEYFALFYHSDITPEQYTSLVENSLGK